MKKQFYYPFRNLQRPKGLWLLLFMLFMHWNVVQAQTFQGEINSSRTYHVYTDGDKYYFNTESARWDGFGYFVITNGATVNFIFHTSKTIRMTGQIRIEKGTVNMSIANDYSVPAGEPTLRRTNTIENLFHVHNSETNKNQCQLNITGLPGKHFIIDGGANITFNGSNAAGWSASNSGVASKGTLLLLQGGKATLNYVDLRNNWFYGPDNSSCDGGAIHLTTFGFTDFSYANPIAWFCQSECELNMTNCNVSKCAARKWGSAIGIFGGKVNGNQSTATLTNCNVTECYNTGDQAGGSGGTIRSAGNTICKLKLIGCTVADNKANCVGGGVFWEATMSPPLEMTNCVIERNYTSSSSGGVDLRCPAVLSGCKIRNNYAKGNGGGLNYQPYAGASSAYLPSNYFPADASITLDANTEITGNHSETDGGGMHIYVYPMNFAYEYPELGWTVFYTGNSAGTGNSTEQYKINIELNGATLSNNSADRNGGGICMRRNTDIYQTNVIFDWGKVENNTAGGVGGACYILSDIQSSTSPTGTNSPHNYFGTCPFPNTDMFVELGSETASGNLSFVGNEAIHGGGLYVNVNQDASVTTSALYTTVFRNGIIGTQAQPNIADGGNGGGVYVRGGNVVIRGGNVTYNKANKSGNAGGNGGGFYVTGGLVEVKGGTIDQNTAEQNGGGFYVNVTDSSIETKINSSVATTTISNNTAVNGAGAYINKGVLKIQDAATNITTNTASTSGGGIYMANGTVTFTNAKLQGNTATNNDGGGLYLGNGTMTVSGTNAAFTANKAKSHGGGVYVGGGNFNMTGGAIGGTTSQGNYTTSSGSYGGGLYMGGGTATLTGGSISGNHTNAGYGGGIYMSGGTCTLSNGSTIGGTSSDYANNAKHGGGIYSANGTITIKGGVIDHNTATDGGGIYSNGPDATVTITKEGTTPSLLEYNEAERGGGIFANRGVVDFIDGQVRHNTASAAGGGMYVNTEGTLNLKGNATLSCNHVPATGKGGGVYLDGTLNVGENAGDPIDRHSLKVDDNYAGSPTVLNNVYLNEFEDVVTLLSDISGKDSGGDFYSHIGFSVDMGFRPVIYAATAHVAWLTSLMGSGSTLTGAVFDDSQRYIAIHVVEDSAPFENEYIYLWACWTTAVTSDPGTDHIELVGDTYHIKSKEGLAWFSSLVNGLNHREDGEGHTEAGSNPSTEAQPELKGVLEADVDMHEFLWVPIGGVGSYNALDPSSMSSVFTAGGSYEGAFDGQGHTVTGLDCRYITSIDSYGLFGNLKESASVSNAFVKDYYFEAQDNTLTYNMGGIAGTMEGSASIANCEARGTMKAKQCGSSSMMGGLVGKMGGTSAIHSSIGIPDVTEDAAAEYIGGIAGQTVSGNAIRNSFANGLFGATDAMVGGLVGKNGGLVENCYARLRGTEPSNFGYFVGDNEGGTVNCCYAPVDKTNYTKTGNNPTGHGNYADTELPYLYRHRDTQVTLAEGVDEGDNVYIPTDAGADKQLMIVLNNWVEAPAQASGNYTKWGRPWQKGDDAKPVNDDLPVLKMPMANAVASSNDDPYLAYNDIDVLLESYQGAGEAIWMYASDGEVTGDNEGSAAKLYIDEHVALINANPLKAYVGITLDNSAGPAGMNPTYFPLSPDAIDWHMISTPLSDAPIGINYTDGDAHGFDWGHPSGMPYYLFYPKDSLRHGYFPSHRYGCDFPDNDGAPELPGNEGSYYKEWDFYSYSEPDYHWINFKRNSASHHHYDLAGHETIEYTNESQMTPGKGYFAATVEETLLQCYGTLNGEEDVYYYATNTTDVAIPRHGYNLVGNPYQAYLNFDKFAEANSDPDEGLWNDKTMASYTILDEDEPETGTMVETILGRKPVYYRTYAYGSSSNPGVNADGYIHPHQGFFVKLEGRDAASVYFSPDQRDASVTGKFRGGSGKVDYPLVNLFAMEDNGNTDVVTVELGRPEKGGALLMQSLRTGNGKIWCRYDGKDYTIAFTQPGVTEVPIRFETVEDTEYTLRWNTLHGDFGYMHLIDNKTGADIDCLATDSYRFSAKKSDYASRFRLVFDYTGVGEGTEAAAGQDFAFMMNGELVVTGEGVLQVFDVTGRLVTSQELHGVQTTVSLPAAASGVYVLRLTSGRQSQVQKMVISK